MSAQKSVEKLLEANSDISVLANEHKVSITHGLSSRGERRYHVSFRNNIWNKSGIEQELTIPAISVFTESPSSLTLVPVAEGNILLSPTNRPQNIQAELTTVRRGFQLLMASLCLSPEQQDLLSDKVTREVRGKEDFGNLWGFRSDASFERWAAKLDEVLRPLDSDPQLNYLKFKSGAPINAIRSWQYMNWVLSRKSLEIRHSFGLSA